MEFPHPLTLGVASEGEVIGAEIYYHGEDLKEMIRNLNKVLPDGIVVTDCKLLPLIEEGRKYKSLMAEYWGSLYSLDVDSKSDISINGLYDSIVIKAEEFEVSDDYQFELKEDSIQILSEMKNKKMNNIIRILGDILGENPLSKGINLTRVKTYKKDKGSKTLFV